MPRSTCREHKSRQVRSIAHPFGLKIDNAAHPLRYVGNGSNILAALNAMVCLGVNILGL